MFCALELFPKSKENFEDEYPDIPASKITLADAMSLDLTGHM